MTKSKLLLSTIVIATLLACNNSGGGNVSNRSCKSVDMSLGSDERVTAVIIKDEEIDPSDKTKFSFEELYDYKYGFNGKGDYDPYYVVYELCDLSENQRLSAPIEFDQELSHKVYDELRAEYNYEPNSFTSGSQSYFTYENEAGEILLDIETAGEYAIQVYRANEDGDWEWVDQLKFEVVE
jgi:hypothetical protein